MTPEESRRIATDPAFREGFLRAKNFPVLLPEPKQRPREICNQEQPAEDAAERAVARIIDGHNGAWGGVLAQREWLKGIIAEECGRALDEVRNR
jgi:hypothetical protein